MDLWDVVIKRKRAKETERKREKEKEEIKNHLVYIYIRRHSNLLEVFRRINFTPILLLFSYSLSLSLSVFLCSLKCFKYFKEIICKNKVCFNFFLLLFRVYAYVHMYMCVCLHNIYCIQVVSVCSFQVIESKRKRKIQKKKIKKTKECQT